MDKLKNILVSSMLLICLIMFVSSLYVALEQASINKKVFEDCLYLCDNNNLTILYKQTLFQELTVCINNDGDFRNKYQLLKDNKGFCYLSEVRD